MLETLAALADLTRAHFFFAWPLFFSPWALAHLAVNDIADIANDRARGMATIPALYGMEGAATWVIGFAAVHALTALAPGFALGWIAFAGFGAGLALLGISGCLILR